MWNESNATIKYCKWWPSEVSIMQDHIYCHNHFKLWQGFTNGVVYNLQVHDCSNLNLGYYITFYKSYPQTNVNIWTWPVIPSTLTISWLKIQLLMCKPISSSLPSLGTIFYICSVYNDLMKCLPVWPVTQFTSVHSMVSWWPFMEEQRLMPHCTATPRNTTLPISNIT